MYILTLNLTRHKKYVKVEKNQYLSNPPQPSNVNAIKTMKQFVNNTNITIYMKLFALRTEALHSQIPDVKY